MTVPARRPGRPTSVLACAGALFVAAACGAGEPGGERGEGGDARAEAPLLVLGASDLMAAFEELVPLFEERTGNDVDVVLGSTGNLATQIRHGAPADVFLSADAGFLDGLIEAGRIDPVSRRVYAVGRLAVVTPPGSVPPDEPTGLAPGDFPTLAIANPEHAPYGRAAREAFRSLEMWGDVEGRVVFGESVAHALQFVRTGNADAGLVALSLVEGERAQEAPYRVVDDALHSPLLQVAGTVTGSARAEEGGAFLDFVLSPEGQEILARYGFEPPPEEAEGPGSPPDADGP